MSPVQLIYDDSKELDQLCLLPGFETSTHPSSFFFSVIFLLKGRVEHGTENDL